MNHIYVHGLGAVSPAGWNVPALSAAIKNGVPLPAQDLQRPGWQKPLRVRAVPPPAERLAFCAHPRLRRASAITHYVVGASCEALGEDIRRVQNGELRLGIIVCMMPGCVIYSRRFYEEVLRDPATASPLLFPETVFNAPASHLAAYLNSATANYTLVGDDGVFLQGVALAADWLSQGRADACIVVGAEETDWIAADALRLFRRGLIYSGGAGALYLKRSPEAAIRLAAITDSFSFTRTQTPSTAERKMKAQLQAGAPDELFCDSENNNFPDRSATGHRLSPKTILGNAFIASAGWQCVAACDLIRQKKYAAAGVSIVGINQQAIGARFVENNL